MSHLPAISSDFHANSNELCSQIVSNEESIAQHSNESHPDAQSQPEEFTTQLIPNESNSSQNDELNEIKPEDTPTEVNEKALVNLEAELNGQIDTIDLQKPSEDEPLNRNEPKIDSEPAIAPINDIAQVQEAAAIVINSEESLKIEPSDKEAHFIEMIPNEDIKSMSDDSDLFKDTIEDANQPANEIEALVDVLKEQVANNIENDQIRCNEIDINANLESNEGKTTVASADQKSEDLNDSFNDEPQIFYDSQEEFDNSHESSPVREVRLKNETIEEEQPDENVEIVEEKVTESAQSVILSDEPEQADKINEAEGLIELIEAEIIAVNEEKNEFEAEKSKEKIDVLENETIAHEQSNNVDTEKLIDDMVIDLDSIPNNSNMMIDELLNEINPNDHKNAELTNQDSNEVAEEVKTETETLADEIDAEKRDEATKEAEEANSGEVRENDSSQSGAEEDSIGRAEALPLEGHSRTSSQSSYENRHLSDLKDQLMSFSEEDRLLGVVAPEWIPDSDMSECMMCSSKFTFTKRRHHCRGMFIIQNIFF